MATSSMAEVIHQLRREVLLRDTAGSTDGQLLDEFISRHDEAALAALVQRHGPMVWGVCRRVLTSHHDAEDAFQATFLVLVRKATSVRPKEMVANWLYGVAQQTALKARANISTRKGRERQVVDMPEPAAAEPAQCDELLPALDEELSRLPDIYRAAIVLCDLEGRTRKEVARQLHVPEGTVGGRLARARAMLAKRLAQRGVTLSGGALAAVLSPGVASAGVPAPVLSSTITAASLLAAGRVATAEVVSAEVAALTEGVLNVMLVSKLKAVTAAVLAAVLAGGVVGAIGLGSLRAGQPDEPGDPPKKQAADAPLGKGAKPKSDEEKLQGVWRLVEGAENGKTIKAEDGDIAVVLTVKGGTAHLKATDFKGEQVFKDHFLVFRLDTGTAPRLIDFADWHKGFEDAAEVVEGIYSVDGDNLTICTADGALVGESREKSRPATFETKEGSKTTTFMFKRGK